MTITKQRAPLDAQVKALLDQALLDELARLAREEERSIAAEVRLAIRRHVETSNPDAAEPEKPA